MTNRIAWGLAAIALILVLIPVIWIMWGVIGRAVPHWQWNAFTTNTQGIGGGMKNAIVGSLEIAIGVAILAGVVGIAGGIYLAEYATGSRATILRGASEVLSGVPSIVLGYVGYVSLVVEFHWGYSFGAALIVLSVLAVPYITKTTEVSIRNVPTNYREGAEALGFRSGYALRKVVLRPALPGIATGIVLAIAISMGETAPLLYTAGWNTVVPGAPWHFTHNPVGYLTYLVWTFFDEPYNSAHQLAAEAAVTLVAFVVILIVVARLIVVFTQRYSPDSKGGQG
ncbi:MAG: phosphate ABC transporter permease PstA [Acidimicrobiales bacterium]|jgi:phosphate transport system permease protein